MRREALTTMDGKRVVRLIPETEADLRELERMARRGELDDRTSFADDPDVWETPDDADRRR